MQCEQEVALLMEQKRVLEEGSISPQKLADLQTRLDALLGERIKRACRGVYESLL